MTIYDTDTEKRATTVADALHNRHANGRADELMAIAERCAALPVLDARNADEILGYDEHGLPR